MSEGLISALLVGFAAVGVLLVLLSSKDMRRKVLVLFGGLPAIMFLLVPQGAPNGKKGWVRYTLVGVIAGSWVGGVSLAFYGWFSQRGSGWEGVLALVYGFFGVLVGTILGGLAGGLYGLYKSRKRA